MEENNEANKHFGAFHHLPVNVLLALAGHCDGATIDLPVGHRGLLPGARQHDERIHLFADFTLDLARGCLLCAGEPVHLRPQAYEVLKHLAENKGRLVSKDRLIETVWRERAVTDDALVQCLMEVRYALGERGKLYVRNVRGRGYIFDSEENGRKKLENGSIGTEQGDLLGAVVEEEEKEAMALAVETDQRASQPASPAARAATAVATAEAGTAHTVSSAEDAAGVIERHKRAAVIALTVLALAAAVVVYFTRFAPGERAIRSVAVLPFSNESGDPNLEYLSDGLSESLTDRLSQLPGVKVIARGSSFKYKGKEVDPREAAKALGVEALVMGKVVQRGGDLQVRAELVDTRDGTQMWGINTAAARRTSKRCRRRWRTRSLRGCASG